MSFPFRRILSPVDFDDNSLAALEVAAQLARQNDGTVLPFHVVPMVVAPTGMPVYVDIYKGQEELAKEKLRQIAAKRLQGTDGKIVLCALKDQIRQVFDLAGFSSILPIYGSRDEAIKGL